MFNIFKKNKNFAEIIVKTDDDVLVLTISGNVRKDERLGLSIKRNKHPKDSNVLSDIFEEELKNLLIDIVQNPEKFVKKAEEKLLKEAIESGMPENEIRELFKHMRGEEKNDDSKKTIH